MAKIKAISFDMDGTLIKPNFADLVWLEGIPKLYSEQYGIPLEKSKEKFLNEYDKIGKNRIEWYDINYWFKKYNLDETIVNLFNKYKNKLEVYDDVEDVLKNLSENYKLIVASNAPREFLNFNLRNISHYFIRIFSSISDYYILKKNSNFYLNILNELNISANEMVHIGDNYESDYLVPKNLGINAFYLDREEKSKGEYILKDLEELENQILRL